MPFSRAPPRASRDHDEVELLGGSVSADLDRALVIGVERESVKPELIAVYGSTLWSREMIFQPRRFMPSDSLFAMSHLAMLRVTDEALRPSPCRW